MSFSFLVLLFAIGNIAVWGPWPPALPGSTPDSGNGESIIDGRNIMLAIK